MKAGTVSRLALAVILGLAAGISIAWFTRAERPQTTVSEHASAGLGDRRPDFMHAGVNGELWRASDFDGLPTLVNFWATWCGPCLREMPILQDLSEQHEARLNVVGIAIDDPGQVAEFIASLRISYPILIGTSDVRATQKRFGNTNGMLPFSVLLDADGIVRWSHLGELEEHHLREAIQPLLAAAAETP